MGDSMPAGATPATSSVDAGVAVPSSCAAYGQANLAENDGRRIRNILSIAPRQASRAEQVDERALLAPLRSRTQKGLSMRDKVVRHER